MKIFKIKTKDKSKKTKDKSKKTDQFFGYKHISCLIFLNEIRNLKDFHKDSSSFLQLLSFAFVFYPDSLMLIKLPHRQSHNIYTYMPDYLFVQIYNVTNVTNSSNTI